jgi:hypothetical protein
MGNEAHTTLGGERAMAKRTKKAVNKSAFVRDFITQKPTANRKAVEEAWLAAGHEGVISSALVSGLRAKMGLTGNLKNQPEADEESGTTSTSATEKSGKPKRTAGKFRVSKPEQPQAEANGTAASHGSLGKLTTSIGDRPTATGRGGNQGKTAFVTEQLRQNPEVSDEAINQEWAAAGNEGGISGSLLYKIRAKEGLTGKKRAKGRGAGKKRRAGRTPEPVAGTPRPVDGRTHQGRVVAEVEADIDRLIFKLIALGGMETIEDELRKVRRLLYRSYSG